MPGARGCQGPAVLLTLLGGTQVLVHALRFIVAALVILFFGFLLPGFSILGFWSALALAAGIAVGGWLVEAAAVRRATPYARGLAGFVAAAFVLFTAPYLLPHVRISPIGALLAALIIGVVDAFVPAELR